MIFRQFSDNSDPARAEKSTFSVLLAMSAKKKKGPSYAAKKGNVEVPVYAIKRGRLNENHAICYSSKAHLTTSSQTDRAG